MSNTRFKVVFGFSHFIVFCITDDYKNGLAENHSEKGKQLGNYRFVVSFDGVVYDGQFKERLKLKQVPFCTNPEEGSTFISFYLIDSASQKVYQWYNEKTYSLKGVKYLTVKLKSEIEYDVDEGAFSIRKK